jgi:hypothetical protein
MLSIYYSRQVLVDAPTMGLLGNPSMAEFHTDHLLLSHLLMPTKPLLVQPMMSSNGNDPLNINWMARKQYHNIIVTLRSALQPFRL